MSAEFNYDVFLSHSSKDKTVVRVLAGRLRADGLKVWFDEWVIKPGDSIPAKIEEGLEHSRVLVLCMSANAFGSDWAQLEAGMFRFRDPLNKERRFLPLRLDDVPIKGSLRQFLCINWPRDPQKQEYAKLLKACRSSPDHEQKADMLQHVARLARARHSEWRRVRSDFEAEAQKYHDVKMSTFYVIKDGPPIQDTFSEPNHAINLWQYYGSTQSSDTVGRFCGAIPTDFGVPGAELSAFGLIVGVQTDLFCKMAIRSGSLLPNEISLLITMGISGKISDVFGPGKPILIANDNPLAKWLNLMFVTTTSSHPERFKEGVLAVDPFVASLAVFDFLSFGEQPTSISSNKLGPSTLPSRPIGDAWSGLRGLLQEAYSTKVIKGILGKAGLPISSIQYTGTYKGPVLDEADKLVSSLDENTKDQLIIGCIQEILALERIKAASLSNHGADPDDQTVKELRIVLARFGHDLKRFEPE